MEALAVVWAVKHFRHYLYGHKCQVYTDHEALKSLINTPHPSGKLARWGLALQEVDLTIHYRSGRVNVNADALSRNPVSSIREERADQPFGILAAVRPERSSEGEAQKGAETDPDQDSASAQCSDVELKEILDYLEEGLLPEDDKQARALTLSKSEYTCIDGILYHVERDKSLRLIPPSNARKKLFDEVHSGAYGAHLKDAKIHGELSKHYWWPRMRADIVG